MHHLRPGSLGRRTFGGLRAGPDRAGETVTSVAVFLFDLDDPALSAPERFAWLDADERSRAAAFRTPPLSRRYVAGHVALRLVLGQATDRRPADIAFHVSPWGRPELADGPFFNLSHSGSTGIVAVDAKAPVGVDVELPDRNLQAGWLESVLCPEEKARIAAAGFEPRSLLRLWVRKEAVLKALGRGLSFPPSEVMVGNDPPDYRTWRPVRLSDAVAPSEFSLIDLPVGGVAVSALARAGAGPCPPILLRTLTA
jgi:4'-phosphopantetheinyl transferase